MPLLPSFRKRGISTRYVASGRAGESEGKNERVIQRIHHLLISLVSHYVLKHTDMLVFLNTGTLHWKACIIFQALH